DGPHGAALGRPRRSPPEAASSGSALRGSMQRRWIPTRRGGGLRPRGPGRPCGRGAFGRRRSGSLAGRRGRGRRAPLRAVRGVLVGCGGASSSGLVGPLGGPLGGGGGGP